MLLIVFSHLYNLICINKPDVSAYVFHAHSVEQIHILTHLVQVFLTLTAEFKVDDRGRLSVCYHSVRPASRHLSRFFVV